VRIATYRPRLVYPDVVAMEMGIYEDGLGCFIGRFLEGFSGEAAFYQFGEVRTPGVSDIDLLIVVQDVDWKLARERAHAIVDSSGLLHYLFVHEPLVVCESLVPCLPFLHTLEGCTHVRGVWEPLEVTGEALDENARLMRHVVWNSFIRVAALELDDGRIGLRRALALMHNLLAAARGGNAFLSRPVSIALSTEEIRCEVLAAPLAEQETLVKSHVGRIVEVLNEVDNRLDRELGSKMGFDPSLSALIPASSRRFLISPLGLELLDAAGGWRERLLRNVQVVRVPTYLLILIAMLADEVGTWFPDIAPFREVLGRKRPIPGFDGAQYAERLRMAQQVFEMCGMAYFFPRPFSHRKRRVSPKGRVVRQLRRRALSQHLGEGR
jgi:hypothetical protein